MVVVMQQTRRDDPAFHEAGGKLRLPAFFFCLYGKFRA